MPGEVSPTFSIGQYDGKTKKAFMGGDVIQATSKDVGWKRALDKVIINKALFLSLIHILKEFYETKGYEDSRIALERWYDIAEKAECKNLSDLSLIHI